MRNKLITARQTYTYSSCVTSCKAALLIVYKGTHTYICIAQSDSRVGAQIRALLQSCSFPLQLKGTRKSIIVQRNYFPEKTQHKKNTQARTGSALSSVSDNQPEIHTFTNCDNEWVCMCGLVHTCQ